MIKVTFAKIWGTEENKNIPTAAFEMAAVPRKGEKIKLPIPGNLGARNYRVVDVEYDLSRPSRREVANIIVDPCKGM